MIYLTKGEESTKDGQHKLRLSKDNEKLMEFASKVEMANHEQKKRNEKLMEQVTSMQEDLDEIKEKSFSEGASEPYIVRFEQPITSWYVYNQMA